jgi:sulfoxide reductase heme-binding subunit YedZ
MSSVLSKKWIKAAVFLLCLAPVGRLSWLALQSGLGANPIEYVTHDTGDWTLIFIVLTLSITPARKLLAQPQLIRFRRMLGLFAFFYGCLHFSTYLVLDKFFDIQEILQDVGRRRFITIGFTGLVLMIPLAITSTAGWIRRLGGRRWQMLHRLVYATALCGVVHYYWLVKSDTRKPVSYGIALFLLLGYRLAVLLKGRSLKPAAPARSFPAARNLIEP